MTLRVRKIDILGAGFAQIGDGGADGLVIVGRGQGLMLCHGDHEISPCRLGYDPVLTLTVPVSAWKIPPAV